MECAQAGEHHAQAHKRLAGQVAQCLKRARSKVAALRSQLKDTSQVSSRDLGLGVLGTHGLIPTPAFLVARQKRDRGTGTCGVGARCNSKPWRAPALMQVEQVQRQADMLVANLYRITPGEPCRLLPSPTLGPPNPSLVLNGNCDAVHLPSPVPLALFPVT